MRWSLLEHNTVGDNLKRMPDAASHNRHWLYKMFIVHHATLTAQVVSRDTTCSSEEVSRFFSLQNIATGGHVDYLITVVVCCFDNIVAYALFRGNVIEINTPSQN